MTRPFVAIERFFERLFERPATRLFHPRLQPVQLQRRLERAMESERRISADRTYVRDRYRVMLNPGDYADFEGFRGTLESDLAESLLLRARQRGYTLLARPRVRLLPSDSVVTGEIDVICEPLEVEPIHDGLVGARRADGGHTPTHHAAALAAVVLMPPLALAPDPPDAPPAVPPAPRVPPPPRPAESSPTAPYHAPSVVAPSAIIEIAGPAMPLQRVAFRGGALQIGRAPDCDIVLADERVSRRHGSITSRKGALIYTDLASTNGSFVNGARVTEIVLGTSDVVRLGNTTLTIRPDL